MTASKLTGGAVVGEERNVWRGRLTPRVGLLTSAERCWNGRPERVRAP